jgi:uncharacterized membrane protein
MLHNRLLTVWDAIRTGLWFVPTLMVAAGAGLAISMLELDAARGGEPAELAWWLNKGDGEDARNLLSTLLTALITMASMTFSITVVALTLAANQYGSRLIRIFRADLRTQATLGLFAATIVYTLLVLRTVEGKAPIDAVPHLAVALGTGLALLCVLALLVFIQPARSSPTTWWSGLAGTSRRPWMPSRHCTPAIRRSRHRPRSSPASMRAIGSGGLGARRLRSGGRL